MFLLLSEKTEYLGVIGSVLRCRTLCSSVSSPLLLGAGEIPRSKGVWNGEDGRIAGRRIVFSGRIAGSDGGVSSDRMKLLFRFRGYFSPSTLESKRSFIGNAYG